LVTSSFTVSNFKNTKFLDRVPSGLPLYIRIKAFIMEDRRSWEMFKHYNITTVMIDSPILDNLTWIDKVKEIAAKTNTLRIYFNNHYGGKAVINVLQFKDMLELAISNE